MQTPDIKPTGKQTLKNVFLLINFCSDKDLPQSVNLAIYRRG